MADIYKPGDTVPRDGRVECTQETTARKTTSRKARNSRLATTGRTCTSSRTASASARFVIRRQTLPVLYTDPALSASLDIRCESMTRLQLGLWLLHLTLGIRFGN